MLIDKFHTILQTEYLESAVAQSEYMALEVDVSKDTKPLSKVVVSETTTRKGIFDDDIDGDEVRHYDYSH